MPYEIEIRPGARRDMRTLSPELARRIVEKLTWLSDNVENTPLEALSGRFRGLYKLRVGDHRVVYQIDHSARHITVRAVGHRSSIYKEAR